MCARLLGCVEWECVCVCCGLCIRYACGVHVCVACEREYECVCVCLTYISGTNALWSTEDVRREGENEKRVNSVFSECAIGQCDLQKTDCSRHYFSEVGLRPLRVTVCVVGAFECVYICTYTCS